MLRTFIERVKVRGGWEDLIVILIPLIEELFKRLMERCFEDPQSAIAACANPTPWQYNYALNEVVALLRRDGRMPILRRRPQAHKILNDLLQGAVDDPEEFEQACRSVFVK